MKEVYTSEEIREGNFELYIDSVYESTSEGNAKDEVLPKLVNVSASGGFRLPKKDKEDDRDFPAYVVLFTSGEEIEWPDRLDEEAGIFLYFGDNREPGRGLHETPKRGNQLLRDVFDCLHGSEEDRRKIPPFLIFEKALDHPTYRPVRFRGLAAPGVKNRGSDEDLVAIWRSKDGKRFQNYRAFFTILDTGEEPVSRKWLDTLLQNDNPERYEPQVWTNFVRDGTDGLKPLIAPRITKFRSKEEQLPDDRDLELLETVYLYFSKSKSSQYRFEQFAATLVEMSDKRFLSFDLTRPWRDGGRDALGYYRIGTRLDSILVECALEAKCFKSSSGIGVRHTSRLISRLRHRQFGILVTTSYVSNQAYNEIIEDDHPVIIFSGRDIVEQLKWKGITTKDELNNWLEKNFEMKL